MADYLLRRLVTTVIAVWGALSATFLCLNLSGNPVLLMVEPGASEAEIARMTTALGYDRPLVVRYLSFLGQVVTGNLPDSLQYQRPAFELVFERMPATILLGSAALLVGVVGGALIGFVSATSRRSGVRHAVMSLSVFGQAVPVFYFAILLIWVFAVTLRWLPAGGWSGPQSLVLPALTLGVATAPAVARIFRAGIGQVVHEPFVRTARAKGLARRAVYGRHVVTNAALPVITVIGLEAGSLLGGTVITETIFSYPGVGRLAITALNNQDYPLVLATVTVLILVFVVVNLVVDLLYGLVDPRTRVEVAS